MTRDLFSGVSEQGKASRHRLEDARVLFNSARWRGAMYLAGYAVECLLKTKLMRLYDCRRLQELDAELQDRKLLPAGTSVFTHQLELLLQCTQAAPRLRQNQQLWQAFTIVNQWIPAWRYTANSSNEDDAQDFFHAIDEVMRWLDRNV